MRSPILSNNSLYNFYITQRLSTYQIATKHHCHAAQIYKLLQKNNIKIRSRKEAMINNRGIIIAKNILKQLYHSQNLSIYQIAPILRCDPSTVARKLHKYQIPIKPPQDKVQIAKNDLENLYIKQKLSTYKIAEKFHCTVHTITKRMKRYNIDRRPLKKVLISQESLKKYYNKEKMSLNEIGKIYDLSAASIFKKMKAFNIPLRNSWNTHIIHIKKPFSGSPTEKAYMIGFRLGDLAVKRKSILTKSVYVGSNTTKMEQVELIKNLFSPYGHVWISKLSNEGVISISALLHPSFSFLIPKRDLIESWILSNMEYTLAFIAGYIDAEGSIGIYDRRARFRVGSYDIGILSQITKIFNQLGIRTILHLEQIKGFIDKRGFIHNGDFWRVTVNEKQSLLKLFDLLLPYLKHAKRINDLKQAYNNILIRNNVIIQA